ncbi:MAG: alpha/beta fold hydrolase [Planctomycetota bacterium JB042]
MSEPPPTHRLPGLVRKDHTFDLPLDPARPDGETIPVFAREVVAPGKEGDDLPWLVFLQGGPGFPSPRPPAGASWLPRALEEFRVLLLDPRGTGRSGRIDARSLARFTPEEQAARLAHYRADAIVADCEAIRRRLAGGAPWTALGQSYGGFVIAHYLSAAPEGLAGALVTGGLPPLAFHASDVYRRTMVRCREKNEAYRARYPDDAARVREIVAHLAENDVALPSGGVLSPRRFQQLGLVLGMSDGFETIHDHVEDAWVDGPDGPELGFHFLHAIDHALPFTANPIYAILHESIYAEGTRTRWAAHRIREEFPEFDPARTDGPILFTGEWVEPWTFDDVAPLRPLKEAAERLAAKGDWPDLYDVERLRRNDVPVAAAVYHDDMYVDRDFSLETARTIRGTRVWITNEHEHNGLRADGRNVLDRLLKLLRGEA